MVRSLRRRGARLAAAVAVVVIVSGCTSDVTTPAAGSSPSASASGSAPSGAPSATGDADALPELVQELEPSVVTVLTEGGGVGSGVVYRADGVIVTNEHVVRGARDVEIGFADGQRVPGQVLAADRLVDVAVVRVERDGLPVPEYRTGLPRVGEDAVVIGSPLGLAGTVTAGIISGLHREIPGAATAGQQALVDLIQTDAPISPGNSGGALLDGEGRVVGLSEAYIPPSQGAVALGFAIPAATVVRVADELLADGEAEHAFLGVQFGQLTAQIAEQLGVREEGALVLVVTPAGPGAEAGLQPGDVITEFAGQRVRTTEDMLGALRQRRPGERLPMTVLREGAQQRLTVVLGERPQG
ncbi:MAG: trypsin-like peptidase domain-containing protein [Actinomycetota bacterium]|nr:trypsin-like peptidase domain-containing protein [Actinomycetota bacterium]